MLQTRKPSDSPKARLVRGMRRPVVAEPFEWVRHAHLAHADTLYATNVNKAGQRAIEHLEERSDRAHRRYLSAIKALAQVRRLLVPMVQVNVAERQVVANLGK